MQRLLRFLRGLQRFPLSEKEINSRWKTARLFRKEGRKMGDTNSMLYAIGAFILIYLIAMGIYPVSYTHLDVYKRQIYYITKSARKLQESI